MPFNLSNGQYILHYHSHSKVNLTVSVLLGFFFFLLFYFLAVLGLLLHTGCLCAGILQLQRAGATLHCGVWASYCGGFFVVEHGL